MNIAEYVSLSIDGAELFIHQSVADIKQSVEPYIDAERTLFGRKLVIYGFALDHSK
jgi:hypothetical protein